MKLPILILSALLTASLAAPSDPILTNPKLKSISTGADSNTNILKVDPTTGALTRVTVPGGSGGAWGSITGDLEDQTDLGTALGLLAPLADPNFSGTQNLDGIQNLTGSVTNIVADVTNLGFAGRLTNVNGELHFDTDASFTFDTGIDAAFRAALGLGNAATLTVDADIATLALPASTTISAFGASLVDDADASAARTTLGLGTLATQSGTFSGTFSGTSSGTNTGDQTISDATISTTDITTNNATTAKHGFLKKLSNVSTEYMDGTGAWSTPPSVTAANPTASVGLTAVNGSASTFLRSDGAPALDVSISPTWTGAHTINNNALGTTTAARLSLTNTTNAAAGAQQVSPALFWRGNGWKTTATAASQTVDFQAYVLPVQGTTAPTGLWKLQSSINGGATTDCLTVDGGGVITGQVRPILNSISGIQVAGGGYFGGYVLAVGSTAVVNSAIVTSGAADSTGMALILNSGQSLGWASAASGANINTLSAAQDTFMGRKSAANIRQGLADAAAPVAQTSSVQNVSVGTVNIAGANRTYAGSQGTGTGVGGSHIFTIAPAGGSSSSQNALVTALTITGAGNVDVANNATIGGALITTPQTLTGAGAVSATTSCTAYISTGAAQALTLANGTHGQVKTIIHSSDGGSGVLDPTTAAGYTTITFSNIGDSVTLQFITGTGWCIVGIFGAVAA